MDFSHQFYQEEHDVDLSQFPSTNLITDSLFVDLFCPPMMKDLEAPIEPQRLPSDDQHVIMIPAPSPPPLIVKEERADTEEKQKQGIVDLWFELDIFLINLDITFVVNFAKTHLIPKLLSGW